MQPPSRGSAPSASTADDVVERIRNWAKRPTAEATLALCDELRTHGELRGNHVDVLAKAIFQRHAKNAAILIALGRLQLAVGKLGDAQQTLVTAGRIDPQLRTPYRFLGEVLLRRGDAGRAEKMFTRCLEIDRATGETIDDGTDEWLRRARTMKPLQEKGGEGAVAAEVAAAFPATGGGKRPRQSLRPPAPVHAPSDDEPTQAGEIPDALRKQATAGPPPRPALKPRASQPEPPTTPGVYIPPPSRPPPKSVSSLPPPMPAPMARGSGGAWIEARSVPPNEDSDATTLPVGDGDLWDSSNPTIPLDRGDDDSAPRIPAPPPRPRDDVSPLPAQPPVGAGKIRPLHADAVTLGEDAIKPFASKQAQAAPKNPYAGMPVVPREANRAAPGDEQGSERPWATERVLDALADAGIYERDAAAASPGAWMRSREIQRPRRRGSAVLYVFLFLAVGGGIGGWVYWGQEQKKKHHDEAEQRSAHAATLVERTGLDALGEAEQELDAAFKLDSRNLVAMRVWLEDRVLRSYVWPTEDRKQGGLASAIERGKQVGVQDAEMSYARIALALSSDDTVGAAAMAKSLDPGAATDKNAAWTELAVGWVLERAGDPRAVDRYAHAAALDPDLVAARLYLAKLAALAGDGDRVAQLTKDVPDDLAPTRDDLSALAAQVKGTATPPTAGKADARRPTGFGWILPALALADPKTPADARKDAAEKAVQDAVAPADLTRIGRLAAAAGDEATASRAALRALEISPIFTPARALAARLALLVGRPDDAARALEGAPPDAEIASLRAWLAYERGDLAGVQKALDDPGVSKEDLERADLASIVKPLRFALAIASKPSGLTSKDLGDLTTIANLGELGPLVAFDVAIDAGDSKDATAIASSWDPASVGARPMRALRLARLARLQGKADEADRLSAIAVEQATVVPRALVERVLVLCALGKGADALALLTRYSLLATDEQPWLRAYANAQAGKTADAKKLVADLKDPDKKTTAWAVRRDALLAIAASGDDKRAKPIAKDMLRERPGDPDVQAVAKTLGVK